MPFLAAVVLIMGAVFVTEVDRRHPLPLDKLTDLSPQVVDAEGLLLRAFAAGNGTWRLPVRIEDVDPQYLKMLIAYEDKRFHRHFGVDLLALVRAAGQAALSGRIVSGGSTITMQLASLLEGRRDRSLAAKLKQMVRALQLEARFTKTEILQHYLTLAPYGGNLEGLRAASLAYFGKEPAMLNPGQAALLVSLPQLPEQRRPDRHPANARKARDRMLMRIAGAGVVRPDEAKLAAGRELSAKRRAMPFHAAHLALAARRLDPGGKVYKTTIRRSVQRKLERLARERGASMGPGLSLAMLVLDHSSGAVIAEVGSPDVFDASKAGEIDMTSAVRSPGSALKPFIYALAFDAGMARPQTLIEDRPASFAGYRPRNFDYRYRGTVTVAAALQESLNIPAVRLLDAVGPLRLMGWSDRAGMKLHLPPNKGPGLPIALGGAGVTLRDLAAGYATLARLGKTVAVHDGVRPAPQEGEPVEVLPAVSAWYVNRILAGVEPPEGSLRNGIAYKTGTSYGYRDAWSVGYDGRYVIAVWIGRPDATPVPGLSGRTHAAPVLFEAWSQLGLAPARLPDAPPGAVVMTADKLPPTLRRFSRQAAEAVSLDFREAPPRIVFPPDGARVELGLRSGGRAAPVVLKLHGGRPPFRWLLNQHPLDRPQRRRNLSWTPDGPGYSTLTVIDARGQSARVTVYLD